MGLSKDNIFFNNNDAEDAKDNSFFHNIKSLSRLTKLHKCFLFGIPFTMEGLVKDIAENDDSGGQQFQEEKSLGGGNFSSPSFFSKIWRHSLVPLLLLIEVGLSAAMAWCNTDLSKSSGPIFVSILYTDRTTFKKYAIRIGVIVVIASLLNALILSFAEVLCNYKLRLYLTEVITRHYYLTQDSNIGKVGKVCSEKKAFLFAEEDLTQIQSKGELREEMVGKGMTRLKVGKDDCYYSSGNNKEAKGKGSLAAHNHFLLALLNRSIVDPEVRLAVDLPNFCNYLKLIMFGTPMFTGYLPTVVSAIWTLKTLAEATGWFLPVAVFVFFSIGTIISVLIGSFFVANYAAKVEFLNGYIQILHHSIAKSSDNVALLRAEREERRKMNNAVRSLSKRINSFVYSSVLLNFFTILFFWGGYFLNISLPGWSWVLTGDDRYRGEENYSVLSVAKTLTWSLIVTLAIFILLAQVWSEFVAVTRRLTEFVESLYRIGKMMSIIDEGSEDEENSSEKGENAKIITRKEMDNNSDRGGIHNDGSGDELAVVTRRTKWQQKGKFSPLIVHSISILQPSYLLEQEEQKLREQKQSRKGNKSNLKVGEESIVRGDNTKGNIGREGDVKGTAELGKSDKILIRNVSFTVATPECHSLLIMGPSGIGKSTLLRVIARLWPAAGGYIKHPPMTVSGANSGLNGANYGGFGPGYMMFLPQRPYISPGGSLAAQVTFPLLPPSQEEAAAGEILSILRLLGLSTLIERYDVFAPSQTMARYTGIDGGKEESKDLKNKAQRSALPTPHLWSMVLSDGELQRVGIARLLFHKPHIAVLDEATSAMDEYSENIALTALRSVKVSRGGDDGCDSTTVDTKGSIHMLTVAHRSTVKAFHDWILNISPNGVSELVKNTEMRKFD